jgi:hypothetical protein
MAFEFYRGLCPTNGFFDKLNRLNLFPLCGRFGNHLSILCVKIRSGPFRMEHDQRVIVKFLWNKEINVHDITKRLQTQFHEEIYAFWSVQFEIGELRRVRQDLQDNLRLGRPLLDDHEAKILATLDKPPFEWTRSIAETLLIGLHLCWLAVIAFVC